MDVYAALPISELGEVGKGAYTEITSIVAPATATPGARVDITVRIRNNYSATIGVMARGALEYGASPWPTITFPSPSDNVAAGATKSFSGYFIMPDADVTIHAYSYFYGEGSWHFDDERTKDVDKAIVYKGTITKKELDYQDKWQASPLYNIPAGTRTRVRITARNDMDTSQRMGIWWQVKDPEGDVIHEYAAWEAWPYTGSGSTHGFTGGGFDLDKTGTYRIEVQLFMNPADQEVVDSYSGVLCTVQAVFPEAEFRQFGIDQYDKV